jgi:hypothetical protein
VYHGRTQAFGSDLKRTAGAGRGLKKEGNEELIPEKFGRALGLEATRIGKYLGNLSVGKVIGVDEVLHGKTLRWIWVL